MKSPDRFPLKRTYVSAARAEAAEATARRIVEAFSEAMMHRWFDEITLDEVARDAGVAVRTILRRFGGKEGLLDAFADHFGPSVAEIRDAPPGDIATAVERLVGVYETWGDSVIRNLAQEPRHAALKRLLETGRINHRRLTAATYTAWLDPLPEPHRRRTLDALVAATDVYLWKLARRDMGRSREETIALLRSLVDAVLAQASRLASVGGMTR